MKDNLWSGCWTLRFQVLAVVCFGLDQAESLILHFFEGHRGRSVKMPAGPSFAALLQANSKLQLCNFGLILSWMLAFHTLNISKNDNSES